MRIEYGVGDGDTTIQTTRGRWLILLLVFLLGAALVLVATNTFAPTPAHAADTCPAEGPDGGKKADGGEIVYGDGWEVCVKAGNNLVQVTADGESSLQELVRALPVRPPIKQEVSHHTVTLTRFPPVITSISAPAQAETDEIVEVSVDYTDADVTDTHTCTFEWDDLTPDDVVDVVGTAPNTCLASHSYPDPGAYTVTVTVADDFGLTDSATTTITVIGFDVSCEAGATCGIGGAAFAGTITCVEFCGVNFNFGGDEVEVVTVNEFTIIYESTGKGTNPGSAFVEVDRGKGDGFELLPTCGKNGTEPTTDCVHINRVNGNHTQYIVFFTDDPNFRFR